MNLRTFCNTIIGHRPWAKDRRRLLPRVLGWLAALATWGLLFAIWYVASAGGVL